MTDPALVSLQTRRRNLAFVWVGACLSTVVLALHPINSALIRISLLAAIAGVVMGAVLLWPRSRAVRLTAALVVLAPTIALCLPARPGATTRLREAASRSLRRFDGSPYVWGGESRLGIDCSGLVRASLIRASASEGLRHLDGDLLRHALALWWNDASARALKDGFRGETEAVLESPSVNAVPTDRLLPADFAVTADGIHVLAYLGGKRWIEADPDLGRVVIIETPSDNRWFNQPVVVVRWRALD